MERAFSEVLGFGAFNGSGSAFSHSTCQQPSLRVPRWERRDLELPEPDWKDLLISKMCEELEECKEEKKELWKEKGELSEELDQTKIRLKVANDLLHDEREAKKEQF